MEIKQLSMGMVNVYLVKSSTGSFLIDTGLPMHRIKLEEALKKEGVEPGNIRMVILTHGDVDHIGNGAYLQKKYGLKVAVHEKDADMCRTGKNNPHRKRKSSPLAKILMPVMMALVMKPLMKKFPLETFEPDRVLSDGQDFSGEGFDAKVVCIPGHTLGSIGILTGEGDFFAGDTINNRKKPETANIIEDEKALAASLNTIKKLKIRNVYPGHGTPFPMAELKF